MPSQQQKNPQPEQPRPENKPADYQPITVDPVEDLLNELAKIQEEDTQSKLTNPDPTITTSSGGCGCAAAFVQDPNIPFSPSGGF